MSQLTQRHPQTSSPVTISGRPRRRAVEACAFCRKRKIKCNNEQPTCANCKIYGKSCEYIPLNPQAYSRVAPSDVSKATSPSPSPHPKQRRLRQPQRTTTTTAQSSLSGRRRSATIQPASHRRTASRNNQSNSDDPAAGSVADAESNPSRAESSNSPADGQHAGRPGAARHSRVIINPNGVSSYHGHTSTLYEEQGPDGAGEAARPRVSDDWISKGLVAEAARQRQLEELNFHSEKLDFDGVDPDLGMHLLNLHWNRQHHSFNVTYRPAFMRDMACQGPYFSKLLLNALYFGASKFSPRFEVRKDPADVRTAGWKYRERVRKLLGSALDQSDITTIQALLIMSNSLFALGDERSAAWLYAGLAFRMIVDLGMHVDMEHLRCRRKLTDEDLEIRRRVFWAAFIVDKIQSLYQGRPVTLKESDTRVPIKFLDTYEEFEFWRPMAFGQQSVEYQGTPAYSVSTFTALCRLSVVMSDILSGVYAERTFDKTPAELSRLLDSLDNKLKVWKSTLPEHLAVDSQNVLKPTPPHVFSLNAMYDVLCVLLHRPFVADGHLYGTLRDISVKSLITCVSAADHIVTLLRAYDCAFAVARAPYLISYACYVAATIHVRIAAKRGADSEAQANLATCLAVFNRNQETNVAIRRAQHIIQGLMERLGVPEPRPESIASWNGKDDLQARGMFNPLIRQRSSVNSNQRSQSGSRSEGSSTQRQRPREPPLHSRRDFTHAAAPETQAAPSPTLGWPDIDGIIQSFVRAPEAVPVPQQGAEPVYQFPGLAAETHDMTRSLLQTVPHFNTAQSQPVGYLQQEYGMMERNRETAWPVTAMAYGSMSVEDDLLFGLNGAAIDDFAF